MPYDSIAAAEKADFPTTGEGIELTLKQINKLAELYDAIQKAGTTRRAFSVAWTQWKKLYKKVDDAWIEIKAASISFGTEPFVASISRDEGIPEHAVQIEGPLIHVGEKNLAEWGVTEAAIPQIIEGIQGIPIRACASMDPHKCDYEFDNRSHVGYGVRAWLQDGWIHAAAAITNRDAAKHIDDGTWTPLGKGGWSVAGLPTEAAPDLNESGLIPGYQPTGISLVFAPAIPAFVGSGFEMVAAAVYDYNHSGGTMTEEKIDGGGTEPTTYSQEQLDAKIVEALEKQKTDDADAAKEAAGAELAKQKTKATDALIAQKAEFDAALEKLTAEDKVSFDEKLAEQRAQASGDIDAMVAEHTDKLAEMTSKEELATILEAHGQKVQADILNTQTRNGLISEYQELMQSSPVAGAPFATDGEFDQALFDAETPTFDGMQTAALEGMVHKAKLVVAAVPGRSAYDSMNVPGQAPGSATSGGFTVGDCKGGE